MGVTRMTKHSSPCDGVDGSEPVSSATAPADEILLVYDWQCPACDAYCRRVQVRPSAGTLRLIDARQPAAIMDEITAAGLDIDEGMVVRIDGRLYYGSEAINALALRSDRSGIFNRLNSVMFGSLRAARAIYPLLRACRNLLLKCLGRTRINNLRIPGNDRF
jgi:predicted DCC family thiol-disulfide oxidoreductase YuxK